MPESSDVIMISNDFERGCMPKNKQNSDNLTRSCECETLNRTEGSIIPANGGRANDICTLTTDQIAILPDHIHGSDDCTMTRSDSEGLRNQRFHQNNVNGGGGEADLSEHSTRAMELMAGFKIWSPLYKELWDEKKVEPVSQRAIAKKYLNNFINTFHIYEGVGNFLKSYLYNNHYT